MGPLRAFFLLAFLSSACAHAMHWRCVNALGDVRFIGESRFKDKPNTHEKGLILWVDNSRSPHRDTLFQYETTGGKTTVWRLVPNKAEKPTRYERGKVHWQGDAFRFVPGRVIYTKNGEYDALFNRTPDAPEAPRKPHGIETVEQFMSSPLSSRFELTGSRGTYYLRDLGFRERGGKPYDSVEDAVQEAERRMRATVLGAEAVYPD